MLHLLHFLRFIGVILLLGVLDRCEDVGRVLAMLITVCLLWKATE